MTKVKDVMTKDVITLSPNDSIYDCAKILREKGISGCPVVGEDGKLIGILSETDMMKIIENRDAGINAIIRPFDLMEAVFKMTPGLDELADKIKKAGSAKVSDVMTEGVISISSEDEMASAAKIMVDKDINRIPVIDEDGNLVGIITRKDIIEAM